MAFLQRLARRIWDTLLWVARQWNLWALLLVLALILVGEGPPPGDQDAQIRRSLVGRQFDFVGWELGAVSQKLLSLPGSASGLERAAESAVPSSVGSLSPESDAPRGQDRT